MTLQPRPFGQVCVLFLYVFHRPQAGGIRRASRNRFAQ
jgi:hypothetical protein